MVLSQMGQQAISPLHMSERGWLNTMMVAGVTASFIHFDQELDKEIKPIKYRNRFIYNISPHITEMGDYYGYMTVAGIGLYSLAFHDYRAFRTSLLASQAAICAGLWIRAGKILTGRMRPGATYVDREFTEDHWFGPFAQYDKDKYFGRGIAGFDAFPSGHTGAAFAMATVFARQYRDKPAVPIFAYTIAGIVGVTRLFEHEHYVSDVFLGGIVGYLCARQVLRTEDELFPQHRVLRRMHAQVRPIYGGGIAGAGLTLRW